MNPTGAAVPVPVRVPVPVVVVGLPVPIPITLKITLPNGNVVTSLNVSIPEAPEVVSTSVVMYEPVAEIGVAGGKVVVTLNVWPALVKTSVVVVGAVGDIVFGVGRVRTVERVWSPREGMDVVMRIIVKVGGSDGALFLGVGRATIVLKVSSPEAPEVVNTMVVVIGDVGNGTAVLSVWRPAGPDVVRRIVVTWLGLLTGGMPAAVDVEGGVGGSTIADEDTGATTAGGVEDTGTTIAVGLVDGIEAGGGGGAAALLFTTATLKVGGITGATEEAGAGEGKGTVFSIPGVEGVDCGSTAVVVVGGTETACGVT